jgi:hypothetical protein
MYLHEDGQKRTKSPMMWRMKIKRQNNSGASNVVAEKSWQEQ